MVYILLGEGFEEIEAVAPIDVLRRANIECRTVGLSGKSVQGGHGIVLEADTLIDEIKLEDAEMIVLPGGGGGVDSILDCSPAMQLIKSALEAGKLIGAICAAPTILAKLDGLRNKRAVCYPGVENVLENAGARIQRDECVTHDRNIITAQAAGSAIDFALKLVSMLRGWEAAEHVRHSIYYEGNNRPLT